MAFTRENSSETTQPLTLHSSFAAPTDEMNSKEVLRLQPVQTKQNGVMPYLNSSAPAFQPQGSALQYYITPDASNDATIAAIVESQTQLQREHQQLQRFVMTMQMDHSDNNRMRAHQAQQSSQELATVKQIVGVEVRDLQDQLGELRAHVLHTKELENGIVGDVGVKAEWREKYSTERIAAAYQTQVDFHAATATKLREVRYALLTDSPGEKESHESHDDDGNGSVLNATDLVGDMSLEPPEDKKTISAKTEDTQKVEEGETWTEVDMTDCFPEAPEHKSTVVENVRDDQHNMEDGPSSDPVELPVYLSRVDHDLCQIANAPWKPLAVRQMPLTQVANQSHNTQTFTWEHIRLTLGGEQWSPGFYFISNVSVLPSKSYWILDGDYEPFLPVTPGQHGAKLTAFFNASGCTDIDGFPDEQNYLCAPVFIRAAGHKEFVYYGEYSQLRFSDKLDYDRLLDGSVPEQVLRYWAMLLAEQGRPAWVTDALMAHFWPKPQYLGPTTTDVAAAEDGSEHSDGAPASSPSTLAALKNYSRLLHEWKKNAQLKVSLLSADTLMHCFTKADADEEPGLRLSWEYLQCVGYDQGFYDMMVSVKELRTPSVAADGVVAAAPNLKLRKRSEESRRDVEGAGSKRANGLDVMPAMGAQHSTDPLPTNMGGDLAVAKQVHDDDPATSGAQKAQAWVPPHLRNIKKNSAT